MEPPPGAGAANLLRAALVAVVAGLVLAGVRGPFYLAGLAVFSVNRFILAALSAALPHTTDEPPWSRPTPVDDVRARWPPWSAAARAAAAAVTGSGNAGYAALALAAAVPYLAARPWWPPASAAPTSAPTTSRARRG